MKIHQAIEHVQDAECDLAGELERIGERHAADSDVYHVAKTLASRCGLQLDELRSHAVRYGAPERTVEPPSNGGQDVVERARRLASEMIGKHELAGMLLLEDLRGLYVAAHRAELAWVVLEQGAKAARDAELLAATRKGREEAERRWKWVRTKVKEASPQVLVAG
jgi:hypothetical protein